jgi:hypothetical protein
MFVCGFALSVIKGMGLIGCEMEKRGVGTDLPSAFISSRTQKSRR